VSVEQWFREVAPALRWFADKGKTVATVAVVWSSVPDRDADFELHVADLTFTDGTRRRYASAIDRSHQRDVSAEPPFTEMLLGTLIDPEALPGGLTWELLEPLPANVQPGPGMSLGVQQSNTSIRYEGNVLIKMNRRLSPGISPEVELMSVMQRSDDRGSITTTYGSLWLEIPGEPRTCLAIASQFVQNQGDGWSTMLGRLRPIRARNDFAESLGEAASIATLTASMHRALSADPWREAVVPEPVGPDDVKGWIDAAHRDLEGLLATIAQLRTRLSPNVLALVDLVPAAAPALRQRLHGMTVLRGTHRLRIHGDYHLGQVLRKPDGGYVAIDFDGEPERPLSERRQKYAPLRDVAGMLRSFAYARGTIEMERAESGEGVSILREWESAARDRFLATYVAGVSGQQYAFVPQSDDDIRQALAALELEKAVYECQYEINNRPNWLWLPLTQLVRET
jgi:maltose alpha-D-glucosyltransferase/alpha-amylase